MDKKKTGELIRNARIEKGYTQNELGNLIGVTNKAISRWEKGDSFPDVGVLESLATILELKIQDIVTGELNSDSESAITEISQVARLQDKARMKRLFGVGYVLILLILIIIIGVNTFAGFSGFSKIHYYMYFMGITLVTISIKAIVDGGIVSPFSMTISKWLTYVSAISGLYAVLIYYLIIMNSIDKMRIIAIKPEMIGMFLNNQFGIVFMINFVCLAVELIRIILAKQDFHWGVYIIIFNVYLMMVYSDALHRMTTLEHIWDAFINFTVIIIVETIAAIGITLLIKKIYKR